jgi:general secretion pathway protein B
MSYILDALRRADAERERGSVPGIHAQPAMLGQADREADRPARRGLWFGGGLGLVLLALLAWWFLGHDAPPPVAPPMAATPLPVTPPPVMAAPTPVAAPAPAVVAAPAPVAAAPVAEAPRKPAPKVTVAAAAKPAPAASKPVGCGGFNRFGAGRDRAACLRAERTARRDSPRAAHACRRRCDVFAEPGEPSADRQWPDLP